MSLRTRILLLVLLATLAPAVIVGAYMVHHRNKDFAGSERDLSLLAKSVAGDLDDKVRGTVQLLHGLSRAGDLDTGDKVACSKFLADVLGQYPQYTGLLTITQNGDLFCDSLQTGRPLNVGAREYFRQARDTRQTAFEVVFGGLTGLPVLQVAYPVLDAHGELRFVLLASLNLKQFARSFIAGGRYPDMMLIAWSGSGRLMVREPDDGPAPLAGREFADSALFRFAQAGDAGATTSLAGPGGRASIWGLGVPAALRGLRINVGVPRDVLLGEATRGFYQALAVLAAVSLLAFFGAAAVAELGIRRPASRIMAAMARVRAGDLAARIGAPRPSGELGDLIQALDDTAGSLQAHQSELEQKGRELRRANRMLRVLSGINALIVRVRDRDELFREACRIAVEEAGFRMAWIGVVDRSAQRISPVAWHGCDSGYIDAMPLGLDESRPEAFGLAGRAVQAREAVVSGDVQADERIALRAEAGERGFRSLAALPLMLGGEAAGVMTLYAADAGPFDGDEMRLLRELADDIAFAMEHIRKSARLDYLASYDPLTGLPNRTLLDDRLAQALAQAKRKGWTTGALVANLDRFKAINDSLGMAAGDALLAEAAQRFAGCLRSGDTLARLGADEFVVVLAELGQRPDAGRVAGKLADALRKPFHFGGQEVFVTASIGIATEPPDGPSGTALLKSAGVALSHAKRLGGNNVQTYEANMGARTSAQLSLQAELQRALERRELVLHYQPKLSLVTGRITGLEALMRWHHPARGLVSPALFVPVLEETGLIVPAGEWAIREACNQVRAWREAGLPAVPVAVNLSARQFLHHGVHKVIEGAIAESGIAPSLFEVEITESDAMRNPRDVAAILARLRAQGTSIAVDDFGTGYSSLAYLKRLPLDTLKIDRSFVAGLPGDLDDASIARAIIAMAHRLGLKVVAEGVETEEQRIFLAINKCDEMQGYLFSPALPAADCAALLRAGAPRSAAPGVLAGG